MPEPTTPRGRPQNNELTRLILTTTLKALATDGYHGTSTQQIAQTAGTSKQALYRRWPNKAGLALEALRYGFRQVPPIYPGMSSFHNDLQDATSGILNALHDTPLGTAWLALLSEPSLVEELSLIEGEQRTHFRQVFVYWNTTATMETSIDQLLGFVFFTSLVRRRKPALREITELIQSITSRS
ncbi:Bacterial regulatory protein, tetR family [Pseudovibrio sp. Ad46]|uniref:TetR/AcrR family transcriptional regulator n=1 Tax=unclassified Pseudovibrio TaxID=2627060 RepID=UPI0007AE71F4|nr:MULTISPECIES: helix-turn-helix domain-containing protein [unclassified Pseudovibrio]KZK79573.1 Bacterial regulatory protein, tetR family [Pseudovibrio sp. Ad46]KZK98263.1 Bacterial regulatory protein, tetR family [Pseudovibrio sp. Ad5]